MHNRSHSPNISLLYRQVTNQRGAALCLENANCCFLFFSTQNEGEGQHAAICLQLRPRKHMATGVRQGQRVIQRLDSSVFVSLSLLFYISQWLISLYHFQNLTVPHCTSLRLSRDNPGVKQMSRMLYHRCHCVPFTTSNNITHHT